VELALHGQKLTGRLTLTRAGEAWVFRLMAATE
jgi:hypothetical protein